MVGLVQIPGRVVQGQFSLHPGEGLQGQTHQWSRGVPRAPPGQLAWPPVPSCPLRSSQTRRSCSRPCQWPQLGAAPVARVALGQGGSLWGQVVSPGLAQSDPRWHNLVSKDFFSTSHLWFSLLTTVARDTSSTPACAALLRTPVLRKLGRAPLQMTPNYFFKCDA